MGHLDAAFAQERLGKGGDVGAGNPRAPESGVDLGGRQVLGLNAAQGLDVGAELRVPCGRGFGGRELGAHVAGEIGVVGLPRAGLGVEEDQATKLGDGGGFIGAEKSGDLFEIDPTVFGERDQQRRTGVVGGGDRRPRGDGAFPEDGSLGGGAGLAVVMFEGKQERQIGITAEGGDVGPPGNGPVSGDEGVVSDVERGARAHLIVFGMVLPLGLQAMAEGVADADQPAEPLGGGFGEVG